MATRRTASIFISMTGVVLAVWIATLCLNIASSNPLSSDGWLMHTQVVRHQIAVTFDIAKEAESNERAYLITGDTRYLDSYRSFAARFPREIKQLTILTRDNPVQQENCLQLQLIIEQRLKKIEEKLTLDKQHDTLGIKRIVGEGTLLMDKARVIVGRMEVEEDRLLVIRDTKTRREFYGLAVAMVLLLLREVAWCVRFYGGDSEDDGCGTLHDSDEHDVCP